LTQGGFFSWAEESASRRALQQDDEEPEEDLASPSGEMEVSTQETDDEDKVVSAKTLSADERQKLELQLLERAVASRKEEKRLNGLLMDTRHIGAGALAIENPPPDGDSDVLFKEMFQRELSKLAERWTDEFHQVVEARESSAATEESLKKLAEWEVRWEEHELDRMLMDAKVKLGFDTLTGKRSFMS